MLNQSQVIFNQEEHTYTLNGVQLQGITGMLGRQLFPNKYADVPQFVLDRAAEKGSYIHEVCELIDTLGVEHDSPEGRNYKLLTKGMTHEESEYTVSDNEHFASQIDKVYKVDDDTYDIGDIKTTCKLDKEYLSWQLSIYAYLFELQNPGKKVRRLFGIWLRDEKAEMVEVHKIDKDIVVSLMACEIQGTQFVNPLAPTTHPNTLPDTIAKMEASIVEIEEMEKYWSAKKKELTQGLMEEMVKAGAYKWEGSKVVITRKKDSIRKTFDKEAFERDFPGAYEHYLKESQVTGSVTLKIKGQ